MAVGEELGRPDPTLALRLLALALTGFGHLEDGDEVAAFLAPNGSAAVQDRIRRAAPGAARP